MINNPFILIARIKVKKNKIKEYLKIAKNCGDAVRDSEPGMIIHTFDQDPDDIQKFTWSEVYKNNESMIIHINNPAVKKYVNNHYLLAEKFEVEVYGNLNSKTIRAIKNLKFPFKHFKTTKIGYFRKENFKY